MGLLYELYEEGVITVAKREISPEELKEKLDRLEEKTEFSITPAEAAGVLGCEPYSLTIAAKSGNLGTIRHFFAGNNLRLSRLDVLAFCGRHPMVVESTGSKLPWA